jgi:hypothetical protein
VVLDGSNDGSKEALARLTPGVETQVISKSHGGLSSARNVVIAETNSDLTLLLDDDMVPGPNLLSHHLAAHDESSESPVMGPCLYPPYQSVLPSQRRYFDQVALRYGATGRVTQFHDVSAANMSGPSRTFVEIGGFDEGFLYGYEDRDFGLRLFRAGFEMRFAPRAVAWHYQERSPHDYCILSITEGRSLVRLCQRHTLEDLGALHDPPSSLRRHLYAACGLSAARYAAVCRLLATVVRPPIAQTGVGDHIARWSRAAGLVAGSLIEDPSGRAAAHLFGLRSRSATRAAQATAV